MSETKVLAEFVPSEALSTPVMLDEGPTLLQYDLYLITSARIKFRSEVLGFRILTNKFVGTTIQPILLSNLNQLKWVPKQKAQITEHRSQYLLESSSPRLSDSIRPSVL